MKNFGISHPLSCLVGLARFAAVLSTAASLTACGGGGDETGGGSDTATGGSAGSAATNGSGGSSGNGATGGSAGTSSTGGSAGQGGSGGVSGGCEAAEIVTIDQTFWHSGYKVTLGDAVVTPTNESCPEGYVLIDAEVYNIGTNAGTFDSRMILASGEHDYVSSWSDSDIPSVEGQRTGTGTLGFVIDRDFALDQATLLVGEAGEQNAIIPIGSDSPESLVTLEPLVLDVPAPIVVGTLGMTFTDVHFNAHYSPNHSEFDDEHLALWFVYDAVFDGQRTSVSPGKENFFLDLPNGTTLSAQSAFGEFFSSAGETATDLDILFEVPTPITGTYTLRIDGAWSADSGRVESSVTFVVDSAPSFGE
jgi:hypothetical protein